jgi:heme-degrading monooxygenase HmoA
VEEADGFVDLQVWQSDADPGELVMVSRWRDRNAFKAYMKSESHRASHRRIDADLSRAIKLERLEHMHTYEVVAD